MYTHGACSFVPEFAGAAATWSGASWSVLRPVGYRSREFACAAAWSGDSWSTLRPVGYIESCFPEKFPTPRQGALVPDSRALLRVELEDGLDAAHALCGLELLQRVQRWHLHGVAVSGSVCLQLDHLSDPTLWGFRSSACWESKATASLSGIDLVNGTPVIDIKPYIPAMTQFRACTRHQNGLTHRRFACASTRRP